MADDIQSNIKINIDTTNAMDSIRLLQNQISAFHTQMAKMGAASVADSRNMQQNLINSINSTGAFTANMTKVKTTAEQFTSSLEKNKLTMGEYFRYAGGASKTFGKLFKSEFETINKVARERVKDLQSQYIKLGRDANGAMQAIRVRPLTLDMQNLGTKTQIAAQKQQLLNQLLKQGSTNLLNFGKNTQWAGRQLMVGFTIPLSIMGAAAMRAYKDIEEAAVRLRRVYGDLGTTNMETDKMVKEIQLLAQEYTKYGVAVKDSMDMAATAAATGKKGADLLAQVASSARLAVLGGVDQQMALKTTISLTDAFGVSTKQLSKDINFLNAVENQTVLSIEDMTIAIPKAAPVIQQLGGDVKDLAFFLTAMKEGGINASESANALKSGLASLINPTNTASKMLQGFGINLREIVQGNKGDVKKTVVDFAKALDTLDPLNRAKAIEQLFGKFQFARMSTLFKNVIEQGSQASEVLKLANQSSLELSMLAQRELAKIESSPLYKFQKSIADFQAQLAPVGEQFMKALTPIINFGADVLKNFNGLNEGVKGFIVKFVAVAGVVGPVLLMSFGLIANAVANVIKGFALMKDIFNKTGKSSLSLGEQVNYMTQEQIQAAAIASSLDQVHSKLKQTFTSEAAAVDALTAAYQRSVAAQRAFGVPITPRGPIPQGPVRKYAAGGLISGPGTGTSDSILARVSNGEAIIPAASVARNPGMVKQLVSGNIPGFVRGTRRVGSGASGRIGKSGMSVVRPYGTNVSNTSGVVDFLDIDSQNLADVSSIYSKQIIQEAGTSAGKINAEVRAWRDKNMGAIAKATALVDSGVPAQEAFADLSQKFKLDMEAAQGPVHKFTQTAQRMMPQLSEDLKIAQTKARQLGLNIRKAADASALQLALPNNVAARGFANQGAYMPLAAARNSAASIFGGTSGISTYGIPRFMLPQNLHPSSNAYKLGTSQEHLSQTLVQQQNLEANRLARQAGKVEAGKLTIAAAQGMAEEGQMRSPSRVTKQKGAQLVQGAVQGMQEGVDDVRRAGTQLGQAAAQGVSQSGRVAGQGSRRASSEGNLIFIPGQGYVSEGQIARDQALANAPMIGPREGTRLEKFKAGMNAGSIYRNIQGADQDKLAGGIRNKAFGASGALAVGSMVVPGEAGQMMGVASMLTSFGGMGAGGIAKGLKALDLSTLKLAFKFGKFIPYLGVAIAAFEAFDTLIIPMIRKNADAFNAISDTLSITQEKIKGINDFFGTEIQLTGIRQSVVASGSQSEEQATIAQQFQKSEQFKSTYQESAQKMKSLSNAEFKRAMQIMATDLFGQGMEKDLVKAIIDSIAIEAKKSSVSIAPELFSLDNPQTKDLMNKNIKSVLSNAASSAKKLQGQFDASGTGNLLEAGTGKYDEFWLAPTLSDPEDIAKFKSGISEIGSYMSALSGQFENGTISGKEFEIQYQQLISMSNLTMGTSGPEAMRAAFISLNAEIGSTIAKLSDPQFNIVSRALLSGVVGTKESMRVFEWGSEAQKEAQTKLYDKAYQVTLKQTAESRKLKSEISGINSKTQDTVKLEQKINDKYDKRIAQIEKIKKLNDQIAQSQQGQLTLAEALNQGDIGAAARAAIDIQKNDVQNALDRQQTGLEDAKKAELKPLGDAQQKNTDAVNALTKKIDEINNQPKPPVENIPGAGNVKEPVGAVEGFLNLLGFNRQTIIDIGEKFGIKPLWQASGGHITGPGSGTSDSIPAMLSNGEYVIRANAVKTIGVNTLDKLNQADKMGFAAGGMVRKFKGGGYNGYEKGGKVQNWDLKDPSAPWNQGDFKKFNDYQTRKQYWAMSQPGSRELVEAGKTAGYFTPGIGSGLAFGDAGTAFGKGDVGGGLLNTAFGFGAMWIPKALGMIGKGLGAAGDFIKTGLGIRGGSNALKAAASSTGADVSQVGKLAPRLGFNLSDAALHSMVKDNFYGNMRTGIRSSTSDSMMNRIAVEKNMMGIPANAPASKTPAYGFLTTKEDVPSYYNSIMGGMGPRSKNQEAIDEFNLLINPMSRYTGFYGSNTIKLKANALGRSTISMGDSLSIWDKAIGLKQKFPKVNKLSSIFSTFSALSGKLKSTQGMMKKDIPGITSPTRFPYIEAHLPGGFTVKDIESIMLHPTTRFGPRATDKIAQDLTQRKAALESLFESMGIKGVKITENGGIKIGNKVLDGNYPLPSRGPKKPAGTPFSPISGPMQGASLPFGFSKAPTKAEIDAVVAFIQNSPLAQIQRGDALASIVGKSTIGKGNAMFRVPTIRQNQELATKNVGDIIDLGKRFTSIAGQSELQAIGMTAAGKLNTGNREIGVNTIIKFVAGEDIPGIMNHKVYNPNYLKSAFGKKADEYPFQSEGLLPPGLKGKIVGISQNGDQRILEVLLSKFAKGGMVRKYAMGGMVPIAEPAPRQFANGGYAMGTDTVPAMLTPGEFVIKKSAVDRIGTGTLNKINGYAEGGLVGGSSAVMGDSVYNYSVNVNVATDSDPNQIARAVMSQIRKVDNHRVRGSSI